MSVRYPFFLVGAITLAAWAAESSGGKYTAAERNHWAFKPRTTPAVPTFSSSVDQKWAAHPIDAFVLKKLRDQGLSPAPPASRLALIRRVSVDLTGLPPTPEAVKTFLADRSPRAYEALVDRLLASPEYAERQARHWLDVVRFAESDGFEYDTHRSEAWQYRDYIIRSDLRFCESK